MLHSGNIGSRDGLGGRGNDYVSTKKIVLLPILFWSDLIRVPGSGEGCLSCLLVAQIGQHGQEQVKHYQHYLK